MNNDPWKRIAYTAVGILIGSVIAYGMLAHEISVTREEVRMIRFQMPYSYQDGVLYINKVVNSNGVTYLCASNNATVYYSNGIIHIDTPR